MSLQVVATVAPRVTIEERLMSERTTPLPIGRDERPTQETCASLTCRDVIDGVNQRLAHKGCPWV